MDGEWSVGPGRNSERRMGPWRMDSDGLPRTSHVWLNVQLIMPLVVAFLVARNHKRGHAGAKAARYSVRYERMTHHMDGVLQTRLQTILCRDAAPWKPSEKDELWGALRRTHAGAICAIATVVLCH